MVRYNTLKDKRREFLAATGLTPEEFETLLPSFEATEAGVKGSMSRPEDKNLLLVSEVSRKVTYLGPTETGGKHGKRAANEAAIAYPDCATLDQDTGFQDCAPDGALIQQTKKAEGPEPERGRSVAQSDHFGSAHRCGACDRGRQAVPDRPGRAAPDESGRLGPGDGGSLRPAQPARLPSTPVAPLRRHGLHRRTLMPIMSTERGPVDIPLLMDMIGLWHGGQDRRDERLNMVMGDGHAINVTRDHADVLNRIYSRFRLPSRERGLLPLPKIIHIVISRLSDGLSGRKFHPARNAFFVSDPKSRRLSQP